MSRGVNVVLLCEDRQQEAFARRFLEKTGVNRRKLRVEIGPPGRGSGEQFVRKRYASEVAYYRKHSHKVQQALVVLIDGDGNSPDFRLQQLEDSSQQSGNDPRATEERIAVFVPARNIETWIAYLRGNNVDETVNYPKLPRQKDCKSQVAALWAMCQTGELRQPAPRSLEAACVEYRHRMNG